MNKKFFPLIGLLLLIGGVAFGMGLSNVIRVQNTQSATALNASQINSILSLLKSFGAEDTIITNVSATLQGELPPTPQPVTTPIRAERPNETVSDLQLEKNLFPGDRGPEVKKLQEFLSQTGDYTYPEITGYYGAATERAVQRWQVRHGVVDSGTPSTTGFGAVGPKTRKVLEKKKSIIPPATPLPHDIIDESPMPEAQPPIPTEPGPDVVTSEPPILQGFSLSPINGLAPLTVSATITTTGGCFQYQIYWGDGTTDTQVGGKEPSCSDTKALALIDLEHTYTQAGTYTVSVPDSNGVISKATVTVVKKPTVTLVPAQQVPLITERNVYSAEPILQKGALKLYFGGWTQQNQVHDNIYRTDCQSPSGPCTNTQTVLDSKALGFGHLNDPSIVEMPGGYYIMYMTGVEAGKNGIIASNNNTYYATSWVNDGLTWSKPQLLLEHQWLPSATVRNGSVELYVNDNAIDGSLGRFVLGPSGVVPGPREKIKVTNMPSEGFYSNPNVKWRPSLGIYQIFAERNLPDGSSVIDYLTSKDGITWTVEQPNIVTPAPGEVRVGTPAPYPTTNSWVYFGSTQKNDSTGFKIRFQKDWNKKVVSQANTTRLIAGVLEALGKAATSLQHTLQSLLTR